MASVRYIILSACQSAGLYAQFGFESEAAAWIEKQGSNPCAYVYYRQGVGVAGFDNVSVVFGGSNPSAALRRVRDSLERSLEFRSERQTEVGGYPALVMTARAKKRVYSVYGGAINPVPPTPTVDYMYFEAQEANSTVALTSTLTTAPNLEYSTDGETWQEWQHTTSEGTHTFDTLTLTAVGDRVYFRGDNPNGLGAMPEGEDMPLFSHFEMTGKIAAGGNIMSLLDKDMEMTEIPECGFIALFGDVTEENPNTALTAAAGMSAVTTIGYSGCVNMYDGCTSLTADAAMPALTAIGENGCYGMYSNCTALVAAADMPVVTSIGKLGCGNMYDGCTSLTAAAAMPALTAIGENGCYGMYSDCTALVAAADMPVVTSIGDNGCAMMYYVCTSLTAAAAMPAVTTIGDNGCAIMYHGCTFNMSDDGTTLNFDFPTPPVTAGETTFSTAYDVAAWMGNTNGFTEPSVGPMYFEAQEANSTVALTSTLTTAPNLEYSTDGETWQEWQHTTSEGTHTFDTLTLTAVGDRVYLRGDNPNGLGAMPEGEDMPLFSHFEMTGKIAAGGNIMSLLDKDAEMTEVPAFGLYSLFGDMTEENPNTALTTAAAMPVVTTIGDFGCANMYTGCTSLTSVATMQTVTSIGVGGCSSMYKGCTSLTAAAIPALTAIGDNGCKRMYLGCTSLTSAAAMTAVTAIGEDGCSGMYQNCTSLTTAAAMPALIAIGENGCSGMYRGCTSLTAAAAMPLLTTIGENGCKRMYYDCTSLTAAAAMPAVTTIGKGGCYGMYSECTFNMSDDGTTLNFDFPTPPITAGETTYSTAYDVAEWMGNTNGFTNP